VIPKHDFLVEHYEPEEVETLEEFRPIFDRLRKRKESGYAEAGRALLRKLWPDEVTYIAKTHWIITKQDGLQRLRSNYAQQRFYEDVIVRCRREQRPIRSIVLKARQLGFSTFTQSWQFEQCEREPNRAALTVSYDDDSTVKMFGKVKVFRRNQWFPWNAQKDRDGALELDNGSTFYTKTAGNLSAGRGDTIHYLHCSELSSWENASEILTGLLQAVPMAPETSIIYESTAKGALGEFYDAWQRAKSGGSEFIPFFAPWFWDPDYALDFASPEQEIAFSKALDLLEQRLVERHSLTMRQLHWRRYKIRNELQGSEAKFRQEFPSTPEEAFLTTGMPVFTPDAIIGLETNATQPLWTGNINLVHG
jgi:hypothetical protein